MLKRIYRWIDICLKSLSLLEECLNLPGGVALHPRLCLTDGFSVLKRLNEVCGREKL